MNDFRAFLLVAASSLVNICKSATFCDQELINSCPIGNSSRFQQLRADDRYPSALDSIYRTQLGGVLPPRPLSK